MAAKCVICTKSVYAMDPQINLDGSILHKPCAKCADCKCQITTSNFVKNSGEGKEFILLCKTHYLKRFHELGSYIGAEKYKSKPSRDVQSTARALEAAHLTPKEGEEVLSPAESPVKPSAAEASGVSTPTDERETVVSPSNEQVVDEKPAPGTIREIQRRLSMRADPAQSSPKSLADLVPDLDESKNEVNE